MNFVLINDYSRIQMSSRISQLDGVTYEQLVNTFGPPNLGPTDDNKIQARWAIEFTNQYRDKVIATIYDYKQYGTPVEEITYWSVGGFINEAAALVEEALTIYVPYPYRSFLISPE